MQNFERTSVHNNFPVWKVAWCNEALVIDICLKIFNESKH